MAKNIKMNNKGSSFDLYIKGEKYKRINSVLLGEHNILNVLGGIGVLYALGIDLKNIEYRLSCVKPINHRLELKCMQGVKVIDDSFNSNIIGFRKAVDVLCLMKEEKWIITPGVIEQGVDSCRVNYELGKYMSKKIDGAITI
jgi:UDP-N-acetylmuramoyl-tripeptide--D-alanyl-D-alanine ligase